MARGDMKSWGRYPRARHRSIPVTWRADPFPRPPEPPLLAFGLGRSYGDVCLNDGGTILRVRGLDRFVEFDPDAGTLDCEAGVSLGEALDLIAPRGFFLPVVPGTAHVTMGGAVANDVHGKNHHRAGTFGCHVTELEVARSSGERIVCGPDRNPDLFRATIGGLGLTGLILRVRLQLRRLEGERIAQEVIPFDDLAGWFRHAEESDAAHEFTVAWVDSLARGRRLGRGVLFRGSFARGSRSGRPVRFGRAPAVNVPFELPVSPLQRATVAAFNTVYAARARTGRRLGEVDPGRFFFPLDAVGHWNRIYGRAGFQQFQCVVGTAAAPDAMRELLERSARSGQGSFLAVLKRFGSAPSPGLLSYPREGVTLALDFPNRGERTARLLAELHAVVAACRGRIYPAKDACMSREQFHAQYADVLPALRRQRDPAFSSSFWRRVGGDD
jgi:FAD/FMN-containing dehydrogenase